MSKPRRGEDPTFYRIEYSRIAQALHAMTKAQPPTPTGRPLISDPEIKEAIEAARRGVEAGREAAVERPALASDQAFELVDAAARMLRRLGWKWVGSRPPWYVRWSRRRGSGEALKLGEFLDQVVEPAAVILYWSCLIEQRDLTAADFLELEPPPRRLDRRLFIPGWSRDRRLWIQRYLRVLALGPPQPGSRLRRVLVHLGVSRLKPVPDPGYRVHYNLACFFSRLSWHMSKDLDEQRDDFLDEGLAQLARCFSRVRGPRREALAEWARADPGLAALREIDRGGFERIVGAGSEDETKSRCRR